MINWRCIPRLMAIVIFGCSLILAPVAVHAQSATAGQGLMQGAIAPSVTHQAPVAPTPDQQKRQQEWMTKRRPPGPPVPVEPGAVQRSPALPSTPAPNAPPPVAPGDFTVFRTQDQSPFYPGGKVAVNEPSVGTAGRVVFVSSNYDAGYSTNGGKTFNFVNPNNFLPSMDGGFCCDQTVIYDKVRDIFAWSLLYSKSGSTANDKGGWRTAFTHSSSVASGSWCYLTWHPDNFGLATTGLWMDYPEVAISNGYIWYTTNVLTTSDDTHQNTLVWRISLDQLNISLDRLNTEPSTCGPINYQYFVVSYHFTFSLVQGATPTMYWASHNSTSSIRIYNWPESSSTISWSDVGVTPWFDGVRVCTAPDNTNPCARANGSEGKTGWVAGGVIGFMWSSSAGGNHPDYPYIRVARFDEGSKALIDEHDIFSNVGAFIYNAVAIDGRGNLAGVVYFAGGGFYPYSAIIIWDDVTTAPPPPWEIYYQVQSASGADSWGVYYSTRQHGLYPNTW